MAPSGKRQKDFVDLELERLFGFDRFLNVSDEFEKAMAELLKGLEFKPMEFDPWEPFSIEPWQPSPLPSTFELSSWF
jgi:hypothetical protein